MNIHEYKAKNLMHSYDNKESEGRLVRKADEARGAWAAELVVLSTTNGLGPSGPRLAKGKK